MTTFKNMSMAAIVASVLVAAAHAQDIKDNILTKSGKRIRGVEVTEFSASAIKFKRGDDVDELPTTSIAAVEWFEPPEPLTLGHAAYKNGEFDNAANLFEEAAGKTERAVLKLEAQFFAARATVRAAGDDAAKAGPAISKLESFLSDAGDNYRSAEARLELGQAQLLAGQASDAEQTLSGLSSMVATQGLDPSWDVQAKLAIAKAQMLQSKLPAARSTFRRAKNAAESAIATATGPKTKLESFVAASVVGEGETFIAEKKYDEALRYFGKFEKDKNPVIAAAAKAGKGEALFLQADETGKKDGLRAAQIALAEANLTDPLGGTTTAKALYYSGKVILALGPDRESSDFAARARGYFDTVVKNYSGTAWAAKAAAEQK